MLDLKEHLKTLVEAHAPSGHEGPVRDIIREAWSDLTDEFEQDGLGSLIGVKRATHPVDPPRRIMLAAHMDEIGLMVRDVVDGFVFIHDIAGVDSRLMLAQPVLVHGKHPLPGVVATIPPHLTSPADRSRYPSFDEMVVDVGLSASEAADLVRIGDVITLDVPMLELEGKRVAAKAMDDRACVAAITVCLDALQTMQHSWDVYATATVQEESGLYGARVSAHRITPDVAVALDVSFAEQPGVEEVDSIEMGGGPSVAMGPNFHPKLFKKIKETAKYHEIKVQDEAIPGASGTDAWAIQVAREGIPTALLSIAVRNMHSPIETLDLRDVKRAGRLLAHFIAGLDADFLSAIEWDDFKKDNDKAD